MISQTWHSNSICRQDPLIGRLDWRVPLCTTCHSSGEEGGRQNPPGSRFSLPTVRQNPMQSGEPARSTCHGSGAPPGRAFLVASKLKSGRPRLGRVLWVYPPFLVSFVPLHQWPPALQMQQSVDIRAKRAMQCRWQGLYKVHRSFTRI